MNSQTPRGDTYECVSVKAGNGEKAFQTIKTLFQDVKTRAVAQIRHRQGARSYTAILPRYALIYGPGVRAAQQPTIPSAFRILRYDDYDWYLRNTDPAFVKRASDHQERIGVFRIDREGDRIQIAAGLHKTPDEKTFRIDKRNRNALVSPEFHQKTRKDRLAFGRIGKAAESVYHNTGDR